MGRRTVWIPDELDQRALIDAALRDVVERVQRGELTAQVTAR